MKCPKCGSDRIYKIGKEQWSKRRKCLNCKHTFGLKRQNQKSKSDRSELHPKSTIGTDAAIRGEIEKSKSDRSQVPPKDIGTAPQVPPKFDDALGGQSQELTSDRSQVPPKDIGTAPQVPPKFDDALGGQSQKLTSDRSQVPPKDIGTAPQVPLKFDDALGGQSQELTSDRIEFKQERYIKMQHYLEIHKNLSAQGYTETKIKEALTPGAGWIEQKWIEGRWGPYEYYRCRIGKKKITVYLGKSKN